VIWLKYVTKLVMYETCGPVMYQLRIRTAGASFVMQFCAWD